MSIVQNHMGLASHEQNGISPKAPKQILVFECQLCNITCSEQRALEMHYEGKNHKKKLASMGKGSSGTFRCDLCSILCAGFEQLQAHEKGKAHLKMLRKKQLASSSEFQFSECGSPRVAHVYGNPESNFVSGGQLDTIPNDNVIDCENVLEGSSMQLQSSLNPELACNEAVMEPTSLNTMIRCDVCECKFNQSFQLQHLNSSTHIQNVKRKFPETFISQLNDNASMTSEVSVFEHDPKSLTLKNKVLKFQDQTGNFNRFLPKFSVPIGYSPITAKLPSPLANSNEEFKVPPVIKTLPTVVHKPVLETIAEPEAQSASTMANPETVESNNVSLMDYENQHENNNNSSHSLSQNSHQSSNSNVALPVPTYDDKELQLLDCITGILCNESDMVEMMTKGALIEKALALVLENLRIKKCSLELVEFSQTLFKGAEAFDTLLNRLHRVANLGMNMYPKRNEDLVIVAVLKYKPTTTMLNLICEKMETALKQLSPNDIFTLTAMNEKQYIAIYPAGLMCAFQVYLTCPVFDVSESLFLNTETIKNPVNVLEKDICLKAYETVKQINWYKSFVRSNASFWNVLLVFKDLHLKRNSIWEKINLWTIQVLLYDILLKNEFKLNSHQLLSVALETIAAGCFKHRFISDPNNLSRTLYLVTSDDLHDELISTAKNCLNILSRGQISTLF